MITIDKTKCIRCGACVRDCVVNVLTLQANGYPGMSSEDEGYCLNCQHCLAVCPTGAVACNGVTAASCGAPGALPDVGQMVNLLRQRRSIRCYKNENLSPSTLKTLLDTLAWTPTGCNVHNLHFTVVTNKEEMDCFRMKMREAIQLLMKTHLLQLVYPKYTRYMEEEKNGNDVVFRNAPHMIVASAHKKSPCREADPWIALSYFDVLAQSLKVGTCWSGFAVHVLRWVPSLRRRLAIPKDYRIAAVLLFGLPEVTYQRQTAPGQFTIQTL